MDDESLRARIGEYFQIEAEKILANVTASATLTPHTPTQGNAGEERARLLLQRHLPSRYGVGTGHVVSFHQTSKQADVVVYDQLDCFTIPITESAHLYSIEGVYAVIEVKGSPTRQAMNRMKEAVNNIASIKTLQGGINMYSVQTGLSLHTRPFDIPVLLGRSKYVTPSFPVGAILILQCQSRFDTVVQNYRSELQQLSHWHDECDLLCVLDEENFGVYGSDFVLENDKPVRKYWREQCSSLGETLAVFLYWLIHKMHFERYTEFPIVCHRHEQPEERWSVWPTALAPAIPRIRADTNSTVMSWPWLQKTRQFED